MRQIVIRISQNGINARQFFACQTAEGKCLRLFCLEPLAELFLRFDCLRESLFQFCGSGSLHDVPSCRIQDGNREEQLLRAEIADGFCICPVVFLLNVAFAENRDVGEHFFQSVVFRRIEAA